ncbi:Lactation elevated protein 1 [Porphyridium purpureum]|uniref:Lactation elevated protein 1 n=1 Tax=Porphyridium purpureum TaxID=35688 RepID=A0A5J4YYR7_PORPP|nr:Lactation elevated protein 1 [Porphyridium purpureum]|eukprot:POR4307..scf209_3
MSSMVGLRRGCSSSSFGWHIALRTICRHADSERGKRIRLRHNSVGNNEASSAWSSFRCKYEELVHSGKLRSDAAQRTAVDVFDNTFRQLAESAGRRSQGSRSVLSRFASWVGGTSSGAAKVPGVYIYGGVGCGKTMLMDIFYDQVDSVSKQREHFHEFMIDFHSRVHQLRSRSAKVKAGDRGDALERLCDSYVQDFQLLCLDEFQVTDIADAVVLKKLFSGLFERGLVLVATSNRAPDELYLNGIQRELFLPFIPLLKSHCHVHRVTSGTDYRLAGNRVESLYVVSTPGASNTVAEADAHVERLFEKLAFPSRPAARKLAVEMGRTLTVPLCASDAALFDFEDLCERPLSATDYLALCQNLHTLCIKGIPVLRVLSDRNVARRFITLVDEMYEHRVKLICSAAASPTMLFDFEEYSGDRQHAPEEVFAADRTVSRLLEMQTSEYLETPWRHEDRQSQAFAGVNPFENKDAALAILPRCCEQARFRVCEIIDFLGGKHSAECVQKHCVADDHYFILRLKQEELDKSSHAIFEQNLAFNPCTPHLEAAMVCTEYAGFAVLRLRTGLVLRPKHILLIVDTRKIKPERLKLVPQLGKGPTSITEMSADFLSTELRRNFAQRRSLAIGSVRARRVLIQPRRVDVTRCLQGTRQGRGDQKIGLANLALVFQSNLKLSALRKALGCQPSVGLRGIVEVQCGVMCSISVPNEAHTLGLLREAFAWRQVSCVRRCCRNYRVHSDAVVQAKQRIFQPLTIRLAQCFFLILCPDLLLNLCCRTHHLAPLAMTSRHRHVLMLFQSRRAIRPLTIPAAAGSVPQPPPNEPKHLWMVFLPPMRAHLVISSHPPSSAPKLPDPVCNRPSEEQGTRPMRGCTVMSYRFGCRKRLRREGQRDAPSFGELVWRVVGQRWVPKESVWKALQISVLSRAASVAMEKTRVIE